MSDKYGRMHKFDIGYFNGACEIDTLLIAASCESRCYAISELLFNANGIVKQLYVFDYKKFRPDESKELENQLYSKYKQYSPSEVINCSKEYDDVDKISALDLDTKENIAIDITGFSIPDLFRIFYVLREVKKLDYIHVFYTEPKHYYFKDDLFSNYELLIGERTYSAIEEYFSSGSQKEEILVCFLGFDRLVSKYVHDRVSPKDAVIINGFPSYLPKLKDISLVNNYELLSTIGTENIYYAKANNPYSAYNVLCKVKEKFRTALLNICVLGTKPMMLGACLFALENLGEVKISYPFPKSYQLKTSEENSDCWHYIIEF